jgi:hypothetical protein
MRPLTVLLLITLGSAVALSFGLFLTFVVILLLPQYEQQFTPEHPVLVQAILVFAGVAAASAVSVYGDMSATRWRNWAHLGTVAVLAVAVAIYWPR